MEVTSKAKQNCIYFFSKHKQRIKTTMARKTALERFNTMYHLEPSPNAILLPLPCKIWHKGLSKGYGQFTFNGKNARAHRWHYKTCVNPNLPDNLDLDHLCRRHGCVELTHLEPVTGLENQKRKWLAYNLSKVIMVYFVKSDIDIYKI
jgi:hypothetical protein